MGDVREVKVPDIGDFDTVDVIEILVSVGDVVAENDSLVTLESDKASMEIPSPLAGKVVTIEVALGDEVGEGHLIVKLEAIAAGDAGGSGEAVEAEETEETQQTEETAQKKTIEEASAAGKGGVSGEGEKAVAEEPRQADAGQSAEAASKPSKDESGSDQLPPHASPGIRRLARELGVDLVLVSGTGLKGRILKEDVQAFVKVALASPEGAAPKKAPDTGTGIPAVPNIDFSKFGPIEERKLSRLKKASARNLLTAWLNVPHVTQFDEADVTDMEEFRKGLKPEAQRRGVKLTPLAFLMKASVASLKEFPDFNSSLSPSGESLLIKGYYHIGVAVDTPKGLVVPVVRDVDQKSLFELAKELGELSERARDGKLTPLDIQGACFTISSLGGIGGTNFTPIVNAPEVAILGVARSKWQPVYDGEEFVPRLILPFSVSYDHRVVDGASGVRFTGFLASVLSDLRRLAL